MAFLYRPPLSNLRKTFDYLPSRDGLALQKGGINRVDSRVGYIADIATNPSHVWQPREDQNAYDGGFISTLKGQNNQGLGHYHWQADPEYPWSNSYTPLVIDSNGDLRMRAQTVASVSPAFTTNEIPNDLNTSSPFTWVTGLITSKDAFYQRGGYWEVEAKIPTGKAAWPALWFYPQGEVLGQHIPEIDLMEVFGGESGYVDTVYYNNAIGTGYIGDSNKITTSANLASAFHKFGMAHTQSSLTFYFDGIIVATKDVSSRTEFWTEMYMLISMQIGSRIANFIPAPDGSTPDPCDLLIRSVRAWQWTT